MIIQFVAIVFWLPYNIDSNNQGLKLIGNACFFYQGSNISGKDGRIHCSLNINTETGRLSARRPNLQVTYTTLNYSYYQF